jgi:fructosamine-3-kinase
MTLTNWPVKGHGKFFLKVNSATKYPKLFEKEKRGLEFLSNRKIVHVPPVILHDEIDNYQLLVLGWIERWIKNRQILEKIW